MMASEVAPDKEGQEEHRGAPEAFAGEDEGQGQGRPEEAEVEGVHQPGEEVVEALHHLMGIKALDVVGADLELLLDDEEAPGEVAQDQPGQGDGQLSQAAEPVGRAQPDQGQARGQNQGGGQGRAFVFAPGQARQTAGGQGQAAPGGGVRQPEVEEAGASQGKEGQGQVGVGDVEVDDEDGAVQGQEGGEAQGPAAAQAQPGRQGVEQAQEQRPPEGENDLGPGNRSPGPGRSKGSSGAGG